MDQGRQAAHWTRLSCHCFRANEVRLQLRVLAYNLGHLWRRLVLPKRIDTWSLTSLQQRLVKTGGTKRVMPMLREKTDIISLLPRPLLRCNRLLETLSLPN